MPTLTPRDADTGERFELSVSEADYAAFDVNARRLGFRAIVTDLRTGQRWRLYGASCEQPACNCDARAVREPNAPQRQL